MDALAFDRASVRRVDQDGHLHVEITPISKANICPYLGSEIPDHEALGLNPSRVYQMFRAPEELQKAAPTFAGKPLMLTHRPINAEDHPRQIVVGSVGTGVQFKAPYLMAPLSIWDGEATALIDSGEQKELSCGYQYRADMTPGTYQGEAYDGVMRDIVGNHVALVKEGRAGADVVVGDSKENVSMTTKNIALARKATAFGHVAQGALMVFLRPRLAQDAKLDLGAVLNGVTSKNFAEKKAGIATELKKLTDGKLAKDASLADVTELLDTLEKVDAVDADPVIDPNNALPAKKDDDKANDAGDLKSFLESKGLSPEDVAKACSLSDGAAAADEDEEAKKKREDEEAKAKAAKDEEVKEMVTKPAMDAAIAAAVKKATEDANAAQRAMRDAERIVRPYVGDLVMAHDSAEGVFRTALTTLGVDAKKIADLPGSALQILLEAQPLPGAAKKAASAVAMDAAASKGFAERNPGTVRIRVV